MEGADILKVILEFLGPLAVVIVGARFEKSRKVEELERKAQKVERENEKAEFTRQIEELRKMIDKYGETQREMKEELAEVVQTMESMKRLDIDVQNDLHTLRLYHERTTRQVNTMANLVIVLAEGMRDNHIDGSVTKAIAAYKKFESEQLAELLSSPVIHDVRTPN